MMKTIYLLSMVSLLLLVKISQAQVETNVQALKSFAEEKSKKYWQKKAEAIAFATKNNIPVKFKSGGSAYELQFIDKYGKPQYYKTDNANAAATISTNKVYSGGGAGLHLNGSGVTLRMWDEGKIYEFHNEMIGRAFNYDLEASVSDHSTHVAGTMIAAGINPAAKGMAFNASLLAYDWNDDVAEMAYEAASGAHISNHSYGEVRGWDQNDAGVWTWYGNADISVGEDYLFGFYDELSADWDEIAYNAPYFLICKSAGNDRNEGPDFIVPPNDGPFDCLGQECIAKNILTVGAVNDLPNGYTGPSSVFLASFSSCGPVDDGRIKPDIVANGVELTSCGIEDAGDYEIKDGTSMSTPSVAGSIALLQQHYRNLNGSESFWWASTLKALVIHTADEAGSFDGPDYEFGWGLMNTEKAALKITEDQTIDVIRENVLLTGTNYELVVQATGNEPLKATICWTDLPGTPVEAQLDPWQRMLVNDLDLTISDGVDTYYSYSLNRDTPEAAATAGSKNHVDNVEVVYIANPTALEYSITVDYTGDMEGLFQSYSMIISGIQECNHNLVLQDETVATGETRTEEASNTVTAAGNGHYFIVNGTGTDGGNMTITAGTQIQLLPGFHSKSGGQFHGYIGPCGSAE